MDVHWKFFGVIPSTPLMIPSTFLQDIAVARLAVVSKWDGTSLGVIPSTPLMIPSTFFQDIAVARFAVVSKWDETSLCS